MQERVPIPLSTGSLTENLPDCIQELGPAGQYAWAEFFQAKIRNPNTRLAYGRSVKQFLCWCETHHLPINSITPAHISGYLDSLPISIPSKKLYLAAIRGLFDQLVLRHVCVLNPALSVRGERYSVLEGKTPEINRDQIRTLLNSMGHRRLIDLRDQCIISTLVFTAARAGAVARLTRGDFVNLGNQYVFHFREKGGKQREIPVRHDLAQLLLQYLDHANLLDVPKQSPLFRSAPGRHDQLTSSPITGHDICRMLKRRLKQAGLPTLFSPHSFRVSTITGLLLQDVPLADVQNLASHSDPRTTRLYDRRQRSVTRNIVERITL